MNYLKIFFSDFEHKYRFWMTRRVTGVDIDKSTGMGTGTAYCTHTVRVRVLVHEFFPKSSNIYLGNLSINTGTGLRVRVLHTSWWVNKYIFIYKVHISIMYTSWSSSDIITLNKINHTWSRGESQLHGASASANHLCTCFWVADPQSCCFCLQALWYVYTCPPLPERKPFRHPGFGSFSNHNLIYWESQPHFPCLVWRSLLTDFLKDLLGLRLRSCGILKRSRNFAEAEVPCSWLSPWDHVWFT